MEYNLKTLAAAYHLNELIGALKRLSKHEIDALASASDEELPKSVEGLRRLLRPDAGSRRDKRPTEEGFDEFKFDKVMHRLRNAVMHANGSGNAAEIDWLLKIILTSPLLFDSVRELDNFLSNMTATAHTTKSTGRDRVVEWYFRFINSLPDTDRNELYLKIAKYIFAKPRSNYREWKEIFYGGDRS